MFWTRYRAPILLVVFILAIFIATMFVTGAWGQDVAVVVEPQPQSGFARLWLEIRPILLDVVSVIVAGVITWVSFTVKRKFSIDIEARHREAFHSAVMSGLAGFLEKRGITASKMTAVDERDARAAVTAHLSKSVPDAMAALNPPTQVIDSIVGSKITLLKEASAVSPVNPAVNATPTPRPT